MRRRLVVALAGAVALALLDAPPALAEYRGTDVFANVSPESQLSGPVSAHPSGHYALDTHVDAGLTNPGGFVGLVPHFLASQLWDLTRFLVLATISLFTWAFSLDLLTGGGSSPGALGAVSRAIGEVYRSTFGQAWLVAGILAAGLWGIWKALVQRRVSEAAGQLALSLAFVLLALFLVHSPRATVGRASEWTNEMSLAFLSGATEGSLDDPGSAKDAVARRLFRTLVHEPWVVLNFGGLRHCVDEAHRPVPPFAPERRRCFDHLVVREGRGGYAERFLRYAPGSGARNAEYEALRDGRIHDGDDDLLADRLPLLPGLPGAFVDPFLGGSGEDATPEPGQFDGYRVDADDRPAVDIQQEGGGFQRLTMAALVFAGDLGAVVLLGSLSLAIILAQVFALVFLAFAPVALVVGVFPGRGHDLFRAWLARLAGALVRKAVYSLVLAVVLSVSGALVAATSSLGWLYAFGLQAAFYWGVFLKRHAIAARLAGHGSEGRSSFGPRPRRVLRKVERATRPLRRRTPPRELGEAEPFARRPGASAGRSGRDSPRPTSSEARASRSGGPASGAARRSDESDRAAGADRTGRGPSSGDQSSKREAPPAGQAHGSANRDALERDLHRARAERRRREGR